MPDRAAAIQFSIGYFLFSLYATIKIFFFNLFYNFSIHFIHSMPIHRTGNCPFMGIIYGFILDTQYI